MSPGGKLNYSGRVKTGRLLLLSFFLAAFCGCFYSVKGPLPPENVKPSESFSHPLAGARVLSRFGKRGRRFHTGVDLQLSRNGGEPVRASRGGVVMRAGTMSGYGRIVEIRHADGFSTRYAHLRKIDVKLKQKVVRGDIIGRVGKSGRASTPHLHFEILTPKFRFTDPMDFL